MKAISKCDSIIVTYLPNVRYLTGFSGSSGCVLITRRKRIFFTDFRYRLQAQKEVKDFQTVIASGSPLRAACAYIKRYSVKTGVLGYEGASLSCRELRHIRRDLKGTRFQDASGCVEKEREVKDRSELSRIRLACRLADQAMESLRRSRIVGKTEREVAWMLEKVLREAGSEPLPFEIIVASGPRAAMPHGSAGSRIIRADEMVVIDLGARVDGYCSDMTRTFATGKLSSRQTGIYRTVREAQETAVSAVRPGAVCADVDGAARALIESAGYGEAFGHALGHGVGLEPHEGPVLSSRSREELEAGMVVTVEPGIYLERIGGVRIEDTVLVGKKGPVMLTKFPRKLATLR